MMGNRTNKNPDALLPGERVQAVSLDSIRPFRGHPFQVREDAELESLKESIRLNGVISPAVVRPLPDKGYEMISGHRRMAACRALGLEKMPVIVRELDDDTATLMMVDANRQRVKVLPSEKAFAYRMRMEALQKRGHYVRTMEKETGENFKQVQRYIRLTYLIPELLSLVDDSRMGIIPAVELSYLTEEEQRHVLQAIETEGMIPSVAQAKEMRACAAKGELDLEKPLDILYAGKGKQRERLILSMDRLSPFFPADATPREIENELVSLLRQRERVKTHHHEQGR
jgi:ParB family chromosome partitioning protein